MTKIIIALIIITISLTLFNPAYSQVMPSLQSYVEKHKDIKASKTQKERLARYEHLIQYFCSLPFIKPRYKVNPDFIRSLIIAESNVKADARSIKNAKGLTQIIYPTGKRAALELARKNYNFRYVSRDTLLNLKPEDLYNPAVNILIACYLIAKYNDKFNGRLDLVVAAWNAGEGSIQNNNPPPYGETLNLIGKVNGFFLYFLSSTHL